MELGELIAHLTYLAQSHPSGESALVEFTYTITDRPLHPRSDSPVELGQPITQANITYDPTFHTVSFKV
jgi:hypothetical protein